MAAHRVDDRDLIAEGIERFVLEGCEPAICDNCGELPARIHPGDDSRHCRPCYQAALNHGRHHVAEAFEEDSSEYDEMQRALLARWADRLARLEHINRRIRRNRSRLDDLREILAAGARLGGECDKCHGDRDLYEDDSEPGGWAYCRACLEIMRARASRNVQERQQEARAAGFVECRECGEFQPAEYVAACHLIANARVRRPLAEVQR